MVALPVNVDAPQGQGFHGKLDDLHIRVAATPNSPARITTLPVSPPKIDTSANPEDMTGDVGSVFSRSDFQGGDGLLVAHRANGDPSDSTRYRSGSGIDVWPDDPGDQPSLVTLSRATAVDTDFGQSTPISVTPRQMTCFVSDANTPYMVYTRGVNLPGVYIRYNPASDTSAGALETIPAFTTSGAASVAEHNGDAYAVNPFVGVVQRALGAWDVIANDGTLLAALPTSLWSVKGRLLAAGSNQLVDVVPGGTSLLMATGGGTWVAAVDAGAFVLAANTDGYVYAFTYDPQDEAWVVQAQTEVGPDATITSMVASYGRVYVGTEWRGRGHSYAAVQQSGIHGALWVADIGADGALENLDRIRTWADTAPAAMTVFKDEVLVYVAPDVWRLDPSVGVGLHRALTFPADVPYPLTFSWRNASILGVSLVEGGVTLGRTFVLTTGQVSGIAAAAVLYSEVPDTYVSTGTIELPAVDFYNAEPKNWLEVTVNGAFVDTSTGALTGSGAAVGMLEVLVRAADTPNGFTGNVGQPWLIAAQVVEPSLSGTFTLSGELVREDLTTAEQLAASRYLSVKVKFIEGSTVGYLPALSSVSVRAIPVADERRYQVPVNVSDLVERPYRKAFRVRGQGELLWQALKAKEGQQVDLELYRPAITVSGVLESVDTPISGFTPRGSATTVAMLTIRGKET